MTRNRRRLWQGRCVVGLVLLFVPAASVSLVASPDFTTSTVAVTPESPVETEIVTFTIVLRNSGSDAASDVYFSTEWPLMGFLVDTSGFEAPEVDHESRTIRTTVALDAGAERRFALRILAPRDSGGDSLSVAIQVSHFASGTEHYDGRNVTIDTRPATSGVSLGGIRVTTAGLATLALLASGLLLWLYVRSAAGALNAAGGTGTSFGRLVGPGSAVAAITLAVGFWVMFGAMAWRDYRSVTTWPETTCTILGGRLSAQPSTRTSGSGPLGTRRDETNYVPVLGLRYEADGRTVYSSGYDTGSRIGHGGRDRARELADWAVGATTRCWYDPADPTDVVVINGFGAAYLFALFPLPVFLIGVARLRSLLGGG